MNGTTVTDSGGVDFYGVLEEVIKMEYLGEPIKHCILFCCDWFDALNHRNTILLAIVSFPQHRIHYHFNTSSLIVTVSEMSCRYFRNLITMSNITITNAEIDQIVEV